MSVKFSVAALSLLAGIPLGLPIPAKLTATNLSSSSINTSRLESRQAQGKIAALQANLRMSYRAIPLGNISSPLTGSDPKAVAQQAFNNSEAKSKQVAIAYPARGKAVVTITQLGLEDDSVGSIRYRVELTRSGRQWRIVWAGFQVKCQSGRGHQNWSPQNCV